eukprot:6212482-Pleurochrysis_carterae.AAC.1
MWSLHAQCSSCQVRRAEEGRQDGVAERDDLVAEIRDLRGEVSARTRKLDEAAAQLTNLRHEHERREEATAAAHEVELAALRSSIRRMQAREGARDARFSQTEKGTRRRGEGALLGRVRVCVCDCRVDRRRARLVVARARSDMRGAPRRGSKGIVRVWERVRERVRGVV